MLKYDKLIIRNKPQPDEQSGKRLLSESLVSQAGNMGKVVQKKERTTGGATIRSN